MVAGGSYPCDEHMIKYRDLDSLCCTPEINETLYINYTQIIFFFFLKIEYPSPAIGTKVT